MKLRIAFVSLLAASGLFAAQAVTAAPTCDINYDGPAAGGFWDAPANWDLNRLPAAGEDACVPPGSKVTHRSGTTSIATLQSQGIVELTGGTLTLTSTADPSTATQFDMSGGTLTGAGTLELSGTMVWSGGTMAGAGMTKVLAGATVTQQTNSVTLSETRTLEVAGTLLMATADRHVQFGGTPLVHVLDGGVVRKTAGGTSRIDPRVDNDGAVESTFAGGTLSLAGGGGESIGDFGSAGAVGTVSFGGGTHTLGDGARLLGGALIASTVDVVDGATVTATNAQGMSGGNLGGPGTFEIAGTFSWSGGTMRHGGVTEIVTGATVTQQTNSVTLSDTRRLEVAGTLELATADRHVQFGGTPRVVNTATGVITKTAGGISRIDPPIENDGTAVATVAGGTLDLHGGAAGPVSTGTFGGAGAAGTVELGSGTFTLGNGSALPGGTAITGGTVNVEATALTIGGRGSLSGNGTLTGPGTVSITGAFRWGGGTMTGSGITRVTSTGIVDVAGSTTLGGARRLENGGLIDIKGNHTIGSGSGTATSFVDNLAGGTIRKSDPQTTPPAARGISFIFVDVRNDGVVESQFGTLELFQGGDLPSSGTFTGVDAANHVVLSGFDAPHILTGDALLEGFTEIRGNVTVREGDTLQIADEVLQTGGEINGDLRIAPTGNFRWTDGRHDGAGTTTIASGATLAIEDDEGGFCNSVTLGDARTLLNQGTLRLVDGAGIHAFGTPRPTIDNPGHIEFTGTNECGSFQGLSGNALVRNTGTVEQANTGGATIGGTVDNDGTMLASGSELRLESTSAVTQSGAFSSTGSGSIVFDSGVILLDPAATFGGTTVVEGAALELPEAMTLTVGAADTLRMGSGATIRGPGTIRVHGLLDAWAGTHNGPGTTFVEPSGTLRFGHDPAEPDDFGFSELGESRAVINRGTITVEEAHVDVQDGASILNRGLLEIRDAGTLRGFGFGDGFSSLVHNTGTIRKVGTLGGDATVPIDNDGTIEVIAGTLVTDRLLNVSGGIGLFGDDVGLTGGTYIVRNGATLQLPRAFQVNAARLVLDGPSSNVVTRGPQGSPTNAISTLHRNAGGGELELLGGRTLSILGGGETFSLQFSNAGSLRLGAGSTLDVTDGFRQSAGGVLRTTVAGNLTAGKIDAGSGPAELGGRLDLSTPSPRPGAGAEVPIIASGSRTGTFADVTGNDAAGYDVVYEATGVKLRTRALTGRLASPVEAEGPGAAVAPAPAQDAGPAPLRLDRGALDVGGPWARRGAYLVATRRGLTLTSKAVTGRRLALVARTCRRCGTVRVSWGRRARTVSLRSRRPARRTIRVFRLRRSQTGTVRVRTTSARRVELDALVVTR